WKTSPRSTLTRLAFATIFIRRTSRAEVNRDRHDASRCRASRSDGCPAPARLRGRPARCDPADYLPAAFWPDADRDAGFDRAWAHRAHLPVHDDHRTEHIDLAPVVHWHRTIRHPSD